MIFTQKDLVFLANLPLQAPGIVGSALRQEEVEVYLLTTGIPDDIKTVLPVILTEGRPAPEVCPGFNRKDHPVTIRIVQAAPRRIIVDLNHRIPREVFRIILVALEIVEV
jgi:hypothetical protein